MVEAEEVAKPAAAAVEGVPEKRGIRGDGAVEPGIDYAELLEHHRQREGPGVVIGAVVLVEVGHVVGGMLDDACRVGEPPEVVEVEGAAMIARCGRLRKGRAPRTDAGVGGQAGNGRPGGGARQAWEHSSWQTRRPPCVRAVNDVTVDVLRRVPAAAFRGAPESTSPNPYRKHMAFSRSAHDRLTCFWEKMDSFERRIHRADR